MGKKKLFNEQQEHFIFNNYTKMSNKDIASILNCKPTQINSWLRHQNIKRGKEYRFDANQIFSQNDIDFIRENYNHMTATKIGEILGFSKSQIDGKIAKLNLDKKKRVKNDFYFHEIDTPLKAYFLGFIYADGYVVCNLKSCNYELGMCLQSQDKYVLDRLNDELGGNFKIYHNNPRTVTMKNIEGKEIHSGHADTLRVYSKCIVEDLISMGVVENKSQKDIFPTVDDKYFFDFLRGYIDGDGCFYSSGSCVYMHITCSSKVPLEYIQKKLFTYNIETRVYQENSKKYRLACVNTKEMKKLVNRLYYKDGLFCLRRKYEKIKHFIGYAA